MINIPPIKPSTEIRAALMPEVNQAWKAGRVLNATAEKGGEALSKVLLRIGQTLVEARTPVPLKTGEQLKLLVKSLGETPVLSIQTRADTSSLAATKLRTFIAQQQDLSSVIKLSENLLSNKNISNDLKQSIQQLLNKIPTPNQLTDNKQLKSIIQNSGVLLEAKLSQGKSPNIQADMKAVLLKLSQQIQKQEIPVKAEKQDKPNELQTTINQYVAGKLTVKQLATAITFQLPKTDLQSLQQFLSGQISQPTKTVTQLLSQLFVHIQRQPGAKQLTDNLLSLLKHLPMLQELKATVDAAVAKITSQQLIPLTRDADSPLLLFFDIPVKEKNQTHLIQFKLEEEHSAGEQQASAWTITVNFDFPSLGAIQAKLHLLDDRITTVFYADKMATTQRIQQHMYLLESALAKAGLNVIKTDVIQGIPSEPRQIPESIHMLDEEA